LLIKFISAEHTQQSISPRFKCIRY